MGVVRRIVFPVLWLVVFAVIAAALFKLAFVDGMRAEAQPQVPSAQLQTATVLAERAAITNTVELQGAVAADPAIPVRSTAEGVVVFLDAEAGQQVVKGERLFQVRKPVEDQPAAPPVSDSEEPTAPPAPLYTFVDVTAPADGTLSSFTVLLNQQVAVGSDIGAIDPGTFSVQGTLSTDQQFRIMDRPNTAEVTINGGPAPFACSDVTMGRTPPAAEGISTQAQAPGASFGPPASPDAGSVSCAVPEGVAAFAGLGASVAITAGQALDAVTVPTTAVQGLVQNGIVWVVGEEGSSEERPVVLGLTDGQLVEITEGLSEGEEVLLFVPGAEAPMNEAGIIYGPGVMGG
ncbi:secretion protein HlyD [Arthrobacter sp. zg-Y916]|uniref:secretion protein HlyD n=1 Tax=Arthrobacter sp. zg-Y916 TaxID=2894190 RepID=UPI001E48641D|nr:secretion protein HlyD [Arthrobacter sp. zg-Y916]MCC9192936.1 secretion protein HlyD [Arthrobacter sp. zg-Y916]